MRFFNRLVGCGLALALVTGLSAHAEQFTFDVEGASIRGAFDAASQVATQSMETWSDPVEITVVTPEGKPVPKVSVVANQTEIATDEQGYARFRAQAPNKPILIKFPGYRRQMLAPRRGPVRVVLEPFVANAVYLATVKNAKVLNHLESLLETTELNAMVIDVKSDWGSIYSENLSGPEITRLKSKGVYLIARIVTFKDDIAPKKFPDMALKRADGSLWLDESRSTFLDPRSEKAWDYVISKAKLAADAGYDEVQFDYVRFPTGRDKDGIVGFSKMNAEARARAIGGFLKRARQVLGPMGVFVGADLFGIAAHETSDPSRIGQTPEIVTLDLDYVCPMVYPSGYANGTSGIVNPVASPGPIVEDSVKRFRLRVRDEAGIRPWLQAFGDYSRRGGAYGAAEIRAQIDASDRAGGRGFMLWNAASNYSGAGLKGKPARRRTLP